MSDSTKQPPEAVNWYILQQDDGHCQIVALSSEDGLARSDRLVYWGPFASQSEAISRRVGLIRAGRCRPA